MTNQEQAIDIKWQSIGTTTDDFKASVGDYLLRIEALDKKRWWYALYFKGEEIVNEPFAKSRLEARLRCEIALLQHQIKAIEIASKEQNPWLSPIQSEREWQENNLKEIFGHYPNDSPKWQYMNGLILIAMGEYPLKKKLTRNAKKQQ